MLQLKHKIYCAIIHNNDSRRNKYLFESIYRLKEQLSDEFECEVCEFGYQPTLRNHPKLLYAIRTTYQQFLHNRWSVHLGNKTKLNICDFAKLMFNFIGILFLPVSSVKGRTNAIEIALTDKHIRAWSGFLDSDAQYMICLEDDLVFKSDSLRRMKQFLSHLNVMHPRGDLYGNLAGGCTDSELGIASLLQSRTGDYKYYNKAVTNTNCCYVASRELISKFYEELLANPMSRFINADWLINRLFMRLDSFSLTCACVHVDPPIFIHGSMNGDYESLVR